jgi:hypothetical protein
LALCADGIVCLPVADVLCLKLIAVAR